MLQVVVFATFAFSAVFADECVQTSLCSCKYSNGSTIDLSSLAVDGEPAFSASISGPIFANYDPCEGFNQPPGCKDTSVCANLPAVSSSYALGSADSATFVEEGGQLAIRYNDTDPTLGATTSYVYLVCDTDNKLTTISDTFGPAVLKLQLASPCACIDGC